MTLSNLHWSTNLQYLAVAGRFFHLSALVMRGFATGLMLYSTIFLFPHALDYRHIQAHNKF